MKYLTIILTSMLLLAGIYGCAGTSETKSDQSSSSSASAGSSAGSIDGRWTGSTEIEGFGTIPLGYDLKANGNKLTGTTDGQNGPIDIKNGKINGNKLSFDVTIDFGGSPITINYTGELNGNKLKLSWPGQGGSLTTVTCTRQ